MSKIFSITIEGIPATTVGDLFEEVERLRINEDATFINIDMNLYLLGKGLISKLRK